MSLRTSASEAAQRAWELMAGGGRALVGPARFDALVGALGLRGFKARWFRFSKPLPDGGRIFLRAEDECIVSEVYEDRVYDRDEPIQEGQVVVDVGGHIGAFALYAARKVGAKGRVVVFEPSPDNLELLSWNLDENALPQIELFPVALADTAGEAELFLAEPGRDNPATNTLFRTEGRRAAKVALARLDDLAPKIGLNAIDLLKIDVEGAELRVLQGAAETLGKTRRVVLELHPGRIDPSEAARLLEAQGFKCRTLFQKPLIVEAKRPR